MSIRDSRGKEGRYISIPRKLNKKKTIVDYFFYMGSTK